MNKILKTLKTKAHALKPVVIIGNHGLNEKVQLEIECALLAHELIKVRINASDRDARNKLIEAIISYHKAELISQVGHTAVFYKPNP